MNEKSLVDRAKKVAAEVASMATDAALKTGDAAAKAWDKTKNVAAATAESAGAVANKVGEVAANACEETKGAAAAATDSTPKSSKPAPASGTLGTLDRPSGPRPCSVSAKNPPAP